MGRGLAVLILLAATLACAGCATRSGDGDTRFTGGYAGVTGGYGRGSP